MAKHIIEIIFVNLQLQASQFSLR